MFAQRDTLCTVQRPLQDVYDVNKQASSLADSDFRDTGRSKRTSSGTNDQVQMPHHFLVIAASMHQ
jgi:hypothetical protein